MKLVVFGKTLTTSLGNGHAPLWRALCRALARRGHHVVFYERESPDTSGQRDLNTLPGVDLVFYTSWRQAQASASAHLNDADAGLVTSCCPDGVLATGLLSESRVPLRVFYDLDTAATLGLSGEDAKAYLGPNGLGDFHLVLSITGGRALPELSTRLGARNVQPFYPCVDPALHRPVPAQSHYLCDLAYLGTHTADRAAALDRFVLEPAAAMPARQFLIGGTGFPPHLERRNVKVIPHVPPVEHSAFFCSSRISLNLTRGVVRPLGFCPSCRMFEAAACGVPVLTDHWEGIEAFFEPGSEILVGRTAGDVIRSFSLSHELLTRISVKARTRTLEVHTADARVRQLEVLLENARTPQADVAGRAHASEK